MNESGLIVAPPTARCPVLTKPDDDLKPAAREIGRRISGLLKSAKMRPAELARQLGITQSAVKSILSGANLTQAAKLATVARTLATTPNYLLSFDDMPAAGSELDEKALIGSLIATFRHFHLSDAEALELAETIVASAKEPPIDGIDQESAARAIVVSRLRKVAPRG